MKFTVPLIGQDKTVTVNVTLPERDNAVIHGNNFGRAKIKIHPTIIPDGPYRNMEQSPADNAIIISVGGPIRALVDGANQRGSELWTDGWQPGQPLRRGDVFCIAGVYEGYQRETWT